MQENKLIKTIKDLYALGQYEAIVTLANSIKDAHDFALNLLKEEAIKEIEALDEVKGHANNVDNNLYKYYQKNWSIKQKVQFILKNEKRFLHFREIARIIISLEGNGDEDQLTSSLSNATRPLKDDGTIVKYKHGKSHKHTFWGSPKWLNDEGQIKEGYMFDAEILEKDQNPKYEQVDLFKI